MTAPDVGSGIYSATYSGIPVYEFQFGVELKEHVMRRRHDDWINATHILKAAGFDKPARTRILEREVQKDVHEKIQGGYGKYQGTWIPLEHGEALARRNNIYDRLRPIFEYMPGDVSPPPAPRHASKPKAPRARPAVPKWTAAAASASASVAAATAQATAAAAAAAAKKIPPPPPSVSVTDDMESVIHDMGMGDDDTPDNMTVASVSYADEDMHQQMYQQHNHPEFSARKRKRDRDRDRDEMQMIHDLTEQQHAMYGDQLLDYFLLSRNEQPAIRPDPPTNFQPNWVIDTERHTALHWACAMGDVEVVKQLKRFGATLGVQNERGETPFMRAVSFTNCFEKQTFSAIIKELFETVDARDHAGSTIIHHAAIMKSGRVTSQSCARYYLDNILNRLQETHDPHFVQQLIDAQDHDGNTAIHLAAMKHASKCIRALLGRGASTDIPNHEGLRAEDLIKELNATKKARAAANAVATTNAMAAAGIVPPSASNGNGMLMPPHRSSSPFAPDSHRRPGPRDVFGDKGLPGSLSLSNLAAFQSEAANTVQSRITSLVFEKFQDLAQSYEDEFRDKADAEKEARRILGNTQGELQAVRREIADLEGRIEPDEVVAQIGRDATAAQQQLAALVTRRSRLAVDVEARAAAASANGSASSEDVNALVNELQQLVREQTQAEADYVEALAAVGTSDNIEKYRRLLRSCLGPESEALEENLDGMLAMMEEEADSLGVPGVAGAPNGDAMEISV
ncbi:transcription factor mbp1 [Ophiostoma piceae UAMH 11346]|uniref:Transcription factor mbp1 n=1 Tax=Ophiostoma piceae (strain UAMH 11346) TaxID=1262450 RepID=S3BN81_OPHP1|nr:transcription factor mbp1 [Ophiostoma piceae UAMH 11346]